MAGHQNNENDAIAQKLDATNGATADNSAIKQRLSGQYMDELFSGKTGRDDASKAGKDKPAESAFAGELSPLFIDKEKPSVQRVAATETQLPKSEAAKPDPAKPETAKPEAAKPEAVKPQPVKPETAKPEVVKTEPQQSKPETSAKPEQVKNEQTKPGTDTHQSTEIVVPPIVAPKGGTQGTNERSQPETQPAPGGQVGNMRIGNHDYQLSFGADGQTNNLSVSSPDGNSVLKMQRDASGALMIASATGDYLPQNGCVNFEGIQLRVGPDGKVVGDLSMDSQGVVKYKAGDADHKIEIDRKADGSVVSYDMAAWKRTTIAPDGKAHDDYWDGFSWRNGVPSADGSRVDFLPPDPIKVSFIQHDLTAGQNKIQVNFPYGMSYSIDFHQHMMVKQMPGMNGAPGEQYTFYYDGTNYQAAQQVLRDQPKPGETTVQFANSDPGDPTSAVYHADGGVTSVRPDNTIVDQNADGYVTAVNGPKGAWQFKRDVNGDIEAAQHTYNGPDGKPVTDTLARSGVEQNPGMEYWYSRGGYNAPRMPNDHGPSDINAPKGLDTYVDQNGKAVRMNINVAADGTVRTFAVGADDKPVILVQAPGGDMTPPTGADGPPGQNAGNVKEAVDPTTGEHTWSFSRAGRDFVLHSKDGNCQVMPDGTVVQDDQANQTKDIYLMNGVLAKMGSDGSTPPKPLCKEVDVPGKNGQTLTLKNGENGVSDLGITDAGLVSATMTGANGPVPTVFNPSDNTKSEKTQSENFWRVSDATDGSFVGTAAIPGAAVWKVGNIGITGPNKLSYDSANWAPAQNPVGPNGELMLVGSGASSGKTASLALNGVGVERNGNDEVYRYAANSSAEYTAGQLSALNFNNNAYKADLSAGVNAEQGPVSGLVDAAGNRLSPLPADVAYHFDKASGKFVSAMNNNNGVQAVTIWDPASSTYTYKRVWQTSAGDQVALGATLDAQNKVVQVALPGAPPQLVNGNPNFKSVSFDAATSVLNVGMANGQTARFNADGTFDTVAANDATQSNHFNRDGALIPGDAQGKSLAGEAAQLTGQTGDDAYQKFAGNVLSRFASSQSEAINAYVSALNQGYLSQLSPTVGVAVQGISGKQVTLLVKSGSGTSASTRTVTYTLPA